MANRKRLADVDRLINSIQLSIASWSRDCNSNAPVIVRTYKEVLSRLENTPVVDAVEVVRCKDCIHGTVIGERKCKCDLFGVRWLHTEAYCAYGERRNNA